MSPADLVLLAQVTSDEQSWRVEAACAQAEVAEVFDAAEIGALDEAPTRTPRSWAGPVAVARAVCAGCPVTQDCLSHALRTPEIHGVWGGTTPSERTSILLGLAG